MEKRATLNGVEVAYSVEGEGHPVVLMHGWGCNSSTVACIANALLPNVKVVNIDLPGFGKSEEPKEVWGVYEYEEMLRQLIAHEQLESPTLIGHSYGGRVAIAYASHNADDVHKLVLVDSAGIKPRHSLKWYVKVYTYKTAKHLLPLLLGKEKGEKALDKVRGKSGSSDYRNSSPMMRAIMSKSIAQDLRHLMPAIKAPTLLIWGENDTATPLADAKLMERLIPDAGLVSFPGCGHYSFLDNPVQFRAVLRSFLSDEMNNLKSE